MEKSEKDQRIQKLKGLYVIVDPEHIQDRPLYEMCELIASAGADIIQLRNKNNDSVKLLKHTQIINSICRKHQTLFILNDHCDLARIAKTDGVHIGRTDLPIGEAKNILNESQIIGNSNATIQEIEQSSKLGADYIAVGAIFFSQTKLNTKPSSLEIIRQAKDIVSQPIVAIGGINLSNIKQVIDSGANAFCVASAITKAEDPEKVIYEMKQYIS